MHSSLKPVAEERDPCRKGELLEAIAYALSEPKESIDLMLEAAEDESYHVRFGAFLAFSIAKSYREDVLCAAIRALRDPYGLIRDVVTRFLLGVPSNSLGSIRVIEETLQVLDSEYPKDRRTALEILGKCKPLPAHAVARIGQALADSDESIRFEAFRAIQELGETASDLAPLVVGFLSDPNDYIREFAARTLGFMEAGAINAYSDLLACLKDPDDGVKRWATMSLTGIDPENSAPLNALKEQLQRSCGDYRWQLANALERLGSKALTVVPTLLQAIEEEERSDVRCALASSAKNILDAYIAAEKKEHPDTDDD
jgi:hypothetical protein